MAGGIFVTGGSGLLALNWALALRERHPVTLGLHKRTIELRGVGTHRASLESVDDVRRAFDAVRPGLVVHAAGLTNVELCEANPALAHYVNVQLAENVARACAAHGVPLAHISTDHVFRGNQSLLDETTPVDPQNTYARTKAAAEAQVMAVCPDALVIRTNFYGWGPPYRQSFSDKVIQSLRQGHALTLFTDVAYTPILAERLTEAVYDLTTVGSRGIIHVVGDERVTKYEFGVRLAARFGLDSGLIRPGLLQGRPHLAPRPTDMSLSNAKASKLLGRQLGDVDPDLERLYDQEQIGQAREVQNL